MRVPQNPPTRNTPHNKSRRAKEAEGRGERTWTNWQRGPLIEEVLRVNQRDLGASDLRSVKPLEYLKVKLLVPTERHHVRLRLVGLQSEQVHYYGINRKLVDSLTTAKVRGWARTQPTDAELDEMVENLTGHLFYRQRR